MGIQPTAERLRELLDYDPASGIFTWNVRTSNRIKIGDRAGSRHGGGYLQINIDGSNHLAHRLAWLYVHGAWPNEIIDHINGDRSDNRIANLRNVTPEVNAQNVRRPGIANTSGALGVSWSRKERKFVAYVSVRDKSLYVGSFDSVADAHAAYLAAKRKLHVGCTI